MFSSYLLLLCLVLWIQTITSQISLSEQATICAFNNNTLNFPVPCSDAVNSCSYSTYIKCNSGATSITSIDLYNTLFSPMILPTEIGNLVSLTYLRAPSVCTTNGGKLTIPTEIGFCTSLNVLRLNNCNPTIGGTLPKELALCNLTQLTLNSFTLSGTIPSLLLTSNTFLSVLTLSNNPLLGGTVPQSLSNLTRMLFIDFGSTNLSGTFPDVSRLTQLQILSLNSAYFTGNLPDPSNMHTIQRYSLSNNKFQGTLPLFNIINSGYLNIGISGNELIGSIPDNFITTSSFTPAIDIRMNNNQFTGTIPQNLFSSINLIALDLNHNQLSGTLSTYIGQRTGLTYLNLGYNNISGSIPSQLGNTFTGLTVVDISYNQLSGTIPNNIILGNTANDYCFLTLNNNLLSGVIPIFGNNGSFNSPTSIDLSHNQLTLDADSFGLNAQNVNWLNLAFNNFSNMPRFNWSFSGSITNTQRPLTTSIFSVDRFPTLVSLDLTSCSMVGEMPVNLPGNYVHMNNNYFTGIISHFASGINNQPTFFDFVLNRLDGLETTPSDLFTDITISFLPQDVDECLTNTSKCQFFCVDGWFPVPGYTCSCPVGYQLGSNLRDCSPVCGNGIQAYPDKECDFVFSPFGCTYNCTQKPGYQCDATGCNAICGDNIVVEPEQCDISHIGCNSQCRVTPGYSCYNNSCIQCSNETFKGVILTNTSQLFPRFSTLLDNISGIDTTFYYQSCTSCQGGRLLETRNVLASTYCVTTTDSTRVQDCSFACSNLTIFTSASQALFILSQELERGDFINQIFLQYFSTGIHLLENEKRSHINFDNSIWFSMDQCDQENMLQYNTLLHAITLDIVPNIPQLKVVSYDNCTLSVTSLDNNGFKTVYIGVIITTFTLILLVIIIALLMSYYYASVIHSLDNEINWSFVDYLKHPWKWDYNGNNIAGYYSREFHRDGKKFSRVNDLINNFFHNNNTLVVDRIEAIYNKSLTISFINHWNTTISRYHEDRTQFYSQDYVKDEQKMTVMSVFNERYHSLPYHKNHPIPLIPVLHGTDITVAEKIARTGFATLSSLDAGFYGKGIYFTTNLLYTLPYCMGKRFPAVIISYTNMGNVCPIVERMTGQPIKNGYNSHYVLTCRDGNIHNERTPFYEEACDEIIVNQEVQILPAFIVTLCQESCNKELKNWERVIADEKERYTTTTPLSTTSSIVIEMESIL